MIKLKRLLNTSVICIMILYITLINMMCLNFNKIASIDSKFDTMDDFYKDFQNLKGVKSKSEEKRQRKIKVLNKASLLYDELVSIYKKRI